MTEDDIKALGKAAKRAALQCVAVLIAFVIVFLLTAKRSHGG